MDWLLNAVDWLLGSPVLAMLAAMAAMVAFCMVSEWSYQRGAMARAQFVGSLRDHPAPPAPPMPVQRHVPPYEWPEIRPLSAVIEPGERCVVGGRVIHNTGTSTLLATVGPLPLHPDPGPVKWSQGGEQAKPVRSAAAGRSRTSSGSGSCSGGGIDGGGGGGGGCGGD